MRLYINAVTNQKSSLFTSTAMRNLMFTKWHFFQRIMQLCGSKHWGRIWDGGREGRGNIEENIKEEVRQVSEVLQQMVTICPSYFSSFKTHTSW
jgi:hypothetical protein